MHSLARQRPVRPSRKRARKSVEALFRRILSLSERYDELLRLRAEVAALTRQEKKKKKAARRRLNAERPPNRSRRPSPVRKRRSAKRR